MKRDPPTASRDKACEKNWCWICATQFNTSVTANFIDFIDYVVRKIVSCKKGSLY